MGHVIDSYGIPQYNNESNPQPDFEANAAAVLLWGNGRRGTSAERALLTSSNIRVGQTFTETDTNRIWLRTSGGWLLVWTPPVRFKASVAGTVSANSNIGFSSIAEDTDSKWNATTRQYEIPVEGEYLLIAGVKTNGSGFGAVGSLRFRKNASTLVSSPNLPSGVGFEGFNLTWSETCAAGDIIALQTTMAWTAQNDSPALSNYLAIVRK